MTVKLKVYTNEDDALLFWSIPQPIAGCRGFAIERTVTDANGNKRTTMLVNRVGFAHDPLPAPDDAPPLKPSTEWPIQRFSWTDHDVGTGDVAQYRVIPIVRNAVAALEPLTAQASAQSAAVRLGAHSENGPFKPFFNRGLVMSQFMARYLSERKLTLRQFKDRIRDEDDKTIRRFLSGDLRLALVEQLEAARDEGGEIFGALFELSDDELIAGLCALGNRAHVVLANGSVKKGANETTAQARTRDENELARATLRAAGVDVATGDRFLSPGALGHNKFLVRTDAAGTPVAAWTGSTNWAPTGLCTQVNNGLLIEDSDVARVYLRQFHRLREAGSDFPKPLVDANSTPTHVGSEVEGAIRSTVWFTRTRDGVDMDALRAEVNKAREGILFLMFMPGSAGLFSTVAARSAEPNLYVRGVVSELPLGRGDESEVEVNLIDGTEHRALHLDVIQPEGVPHAFAFFAEEVTRTEFLRNVGHAIIHSKVLVIDPFSADPVVITGSHNFSTTASAKNDENFIIVRGDASLAEAYAVNILGAYAHYRWRVQLATTQRPFNGLRDDDRWMAPMLARNRRDLRFWGV
jgi:phosphatidylserine/phosphatidylglycerophosphate/cardiolipin synthase-like enzyme